MHVRIDLVCMRGCTHISNYSIRSIERAEYIVFFKRYEHWHCVISLRHLSRAMMISVLYRFSDSEGWRIYDSPIWHDVCDKCNVDDYYHSTTCVFFKYPQLCNWHLTRGRDVF